MIVVLVVVQHLFGREDDTPSGFVSCRSIANMARAGYQACEIDVEVLHTQIAHPLSTCSTLLQDSKLFVF